MAGGIVFVTPQGGTRDDDSHDGAAGGGLEIDRRDREEGTDHDPRTRRPQAQPSEASRERADRLAGDDDRPSRQIHGDLLDRPARCSQIHAVRGDLGCRHRAAARTANRSRGPSRAGLTNRCFTCDACRRCRSRRYRGGAEGAARRRRAHREWPRVVRRAAPRARRSGTRDGQRGTRRARLRSRAG